ncbi:hypothetical protein [Nostoc sp. CHAB 5715]|uniref:hypothetical protein n=1 Tax=Nostoc sp. CHAB 5715 TaxID=2780400 RepID=UPI001E5CB48D|nr:hypothetical protein [Nostoc sp. CHAB 5715]MCC5625839.1 hypothetical protein [Nostoc sp. CHAB 5715]
MQGDALALSTDALALSTDALALLADALALSADALALLADALALLADALALSVDALALQGIAKFNSLRINEMLYLAAVALLVVPTLLTAPASAQTKVYVVGATRLY